MVHYAKSNTPVIIIAGRGYKSYNNMAIFRVVEPPFRELKYLIGLLHFQTKKEVHILQEIVARIIMYNFASLITPSVMIERKSNKFACKANFSVAIHAYCTFSPGNMSHLILKLLSPDLFHLFEPVEQIREDHSQRGP